MNTSSVFQNSLQNQFLVAMPHQHDQHFNEAVIYICEHDEDGAMGLIINKPLPINLNALAQQMGIAVNTQTPTQQQAHIVNPFQGSVFYGGPCEGDHGFILHNGGSAWSSTTQLSEALFLTSSEQILSDIAQLKGPEQYLLALGYAGWEAGQLEEEMKHNVWLNVPADIETTFAFPPEQRWSHAAANLGVDIHLLSTDFGLA